MKTRQRIVSLIAVAILLISLAVYVAFINPSTAPRRQTLVDHATLQTLVTKNASSVSLRHLGPGVRPPTNSWLSGMVLQATPQAVYPYPLSFLATESGFEFGLPIITASATTIAGGHTPAAHITISDAQTFQLIHYDKVTASLMYQTAAGRSLGQVTLAQGSPYVYFQAATDTNLTLTIPAAAVKSHSDNYLRFTSNGQDYAIVGAGMRQQGDAVTISALTGELVTFYALGGSPSDQLRSMAGNVLIGADVKAGRRGNDSTTTLSYHTQNNQPTLVAALPYETVSIKGPALTSYDTIYGSMAAHRASGFTASAPVISASNQLDLSKLSGAQIDQLTTSLKADAATTVIDKRDSYFAGKQLARAANLLDIAQKLSQPAIAHSLQQKLNTAFDSRLGADYFYYDISLRGVAPTVNSFGSEDFNDHHFHYGYFIYAASILGKYDPSFVDRHGKEVNLLVADIASYQASADFPVQRYFDPYAGHSWASGLAPFADGNNQESSSEAIQAWNATTLWAQVTHNATLEAAGSWLLSNETASAARSWRSVDTTPQGFDQYTSPLVDINWGGKRTYATFFSDDAVTKLGIQLIPLNPVMVNFSNDNLHIGQAISASIHDDNYNAPLGDYALMYLSLTDSSKAALLSTKQQASFIDDGNSRTYLDAWIDSQANH
ncbi:MAG: glycosyl hydrolase [Candidatus Saccharibacteria bacterium]